MEKIPPIKTIISFESVARNKSVNLAAEELKLSTSAISHQIARLEKFIGNDLFFRQGRGLQLTPVGERYLKEIAGLLSGLLHATQTAANNNQSEELRVHSSPTFGLMWLLPRIKNFQTKYPDIQINLSCSHVYVPFTHGDYDIDIRYGFPHWKGVEIETLKSDYLLPLISPNHPFLSEIKSPEDLLKQKLIYSETPPINWPQWFLRNDISAQDISYAFHFDRSYMSLEAAALEQGIALESSLLATNLVEQGRLKAVFSEEFAIEVNLHHLVYPKEGKSISRVSTFINWIHEEMYSAKKTN